MVKKIKGEEIVVSVLQNAKTEVKLGLIEVKRGSAQNIFNGMKELIDKFDIWLSIRMVLAYTTSAKNGLVAKTMQHFDKLHIE